MKKQVIKLMTVLLVIFTITGCKKDSNNSNVETFSHRIISEKYYTGDILEGEGLYEYSGNKLSNASYTIRASYITPNAIINVSKVNLFEYPSANMITGSYTEKYDGVIQNVSEIEIKLDNSKVIEITEGEYKCIYTYNNSGQIEEIVDYESDILRDNDTYTYTSGKLTQMIHVSYEGSLTFLYKCDYTYNGDEINEKIEYNKEGEVWEIVGKGVFTYTSGKLVKILYYSYSNNNWVLSVYHSEFKYDSDGNLIESASINSENLESTEKTKYYYEDGSGNYRQIFDAYNYFQTEPIPNKKSPTINRVINKLWKCKISKLSNKSK